MAIYLGTLPAADAREAGAYVQQKSAAFGHAYVRSRGRPNRGGSNLDKAVFGQLKYSWENVLSDFWRAWWIDTCGPAQQGRYRGLCGADSGWSGWCTAWYAYSLATGLPPSDKWSLTLPDMRWAYISATNTGSQEIQLNIRLWDDGTGDHEQGIDIYQLNPRKFTADNSRYQSRLLHVDCNWTTGEDEHILDVPAVYPFATGDEMRILFIQRMATHYEAIIEDSIIVT